ncbi:MAG: hypothetical protein ACTHKZ_08610, partial [Lysobacteraceae bacterium]
MPAWSHGQNLITICNLLAANRLWARLAIKAMRVWLPTVRAGSGTDVFTERLAAALRHFGVDVSITWFPWQAELLPEAMTHIRPPAGTDVIHANAINAHAFLSHGIPVVATVHHLVHDPAFASSRSVL